MKPSRWLDQETRCPGAAVRLFCFPYAGAGPSSFRRLAHGLRRSVDVLRIHLPGREERLGERAYEDMDSLVEALVPELEPYVRGRSIFLGYSLGALVAFEVARALQGGARPLERLVACASGAPSTVQSTGIAADDDDALLTRLRELGATPPRLLQDRATMSVLLPAIRADFRVLDRYCFEPGPALRCGVHALGGSQDAAVPPQDLRAWQVHTTARCEVRMLAGDHFFIHGAHESFERQVLHSLGSAELCAAPAEHMT
jgi:medium-chain acyl-[acyl-carrier-protein] hydrolase